MDRGIIPLKIGVERFVCDCQEEFIDIHNYPAKYKDNKGRNLLRCKKCGRIYEINGEHKMMLSKHKFIFHIYMEDKTNIIHIEKFPVIYINKHYAYYKIGVEEDLSKIDLTKCYYDLASIINKINDLIKTKQISQYFKLSYWFFINNVPDESIYDNPNIKYIRSIIERYSKYREIKENLKSINELYKRIDVLSNKTNEAIDSYCNRYEDGKDDIKDLMKEFNSKLGLIIKEGENNNA